METYDFLVIGAGSGGVRVARLLGAKGYKVAIIEKREIGGTCVLRGCIPKKLFIYAAGTAREFAYADKIGWEVSAEQNKNSKFKIQKFMELKDAELKRLSNIYREVLFNNNVQIIAGVASFVSSNVIMVNGKEYKGKHIIIATGSAPRKLEVKGEEHGISSEEFLNLKTVPQKVLILGGGFIALEFANILLSLGVEVAMFIRSGLPLRGFDADVSIHIKNELSKQGVKFIDNDTLKQIIKNPNGSLTAEFEKNSSITSCQILKLIGRVPNVAKLNLSAAKIDLNSKSAIIVNEYFETTAKNVYALGDVIDKVNLTPVATKQAMYLAANIEKPDKKPFSYEFIPSAVFSYPEVGACGLTEKEAISEGYEIDIYKSTFTPLKHSLLQTNLKSFFKIVVDRKTRKVLGMHIVDLNAGEITQGFGAALKIGITKEQLDDVIGIHPTSSEELVTMYSKSN